MAETKPIASLSPQLLARKGGARPAMRPAITTLPLPAAAPGADDQGWHDLGWNDMGEGPVAAEPVPLAAVPDNAPPALAEPAAELPAVVRQQRKLARQLGVERRSALAEGRRAAFTLRLDAERHLKLRLACTIRGRSAQGLLTEALDRLIAEIPAATEIATTLAKKRA